MKKKINSFFHNVLLFVFCIIILTIIGYCVYHFQLGSGYFHTQANQAVEMYSQQTKNTAETAIEQAFLGVKELAVDVSSISDMQQLEDFAEHKISELDLISLQFLKEGVTECEFGQMVGYSGKELLREEITSRRFGNSIIYTDKTVSMPCVAVFCPVSGNSRVDGVLAYYSLDSLFGGNPMLHEKADSYYLVTTDGGVEQTKSHENEESNDIHNIFVYLSDMTENKPEADVVKQLVSGKTEGIRSLNIGGETYLVASFPLSCLDEDYSILQIFEEKSVLQGEQVLSKSIFAFAMFIIMLSVVAMLVCVLIVRSNKKKMMGESEIDPMLGCNTYNKFAYEARFILDQNRFSRYAVVAFDVYKFQYLNERIGAEEAEKLLKYISNVCKQMTDVNETIGHVINDSFVILMHYTDMTNLAERIKLLGALVSGYRMKNKLAMDIRLSVGIYLVQGDRSQNIQKMFDCAKLALQTNKMRVDAPFTVYDSSVASTYLQEAEMEFKMNQALKNKDFKLFFQPKYSMAEDKIDSAEVLVRWYNPETKSYIAPDTFIRVFEANGFVCELDHYVFEETCRFLNDLTEHGEKIVPLAVNVSRATAIKPDFLSFYVEKKKEYGVQDGFITLEFTETFASESYSLLAELLSVLKKNGFQCAIDDFGMGNSSLIAVKELPVDELKFDRALIKKSKDTAKDDVLLKMLMDVTKEIGMTVTQEGVETREDMERLRALGCDIMQGYYYAKPMQLVDFIDFLKSDTSIAGVKGLQKR